MSKTYDEMTPAEKRQADKHTREAGANEVAGSRSYYEGCKQKQPMTQRNKRSGRTMDR